MSEKEKKICIVVKIFLEHSDYTNEKIAELTGLSSSSVQRYLNDPVIKNLFDADTYNKIQDLVYKNRIEGRRRGGINSFKNNEPIKNENGLFIGSKKSNLNNRLEQKSMDILIFANMFLDNPNLSLQDIADFYNKYYPNSEKIVTRDYVYDCLSSKTSYTWLADNLYEVISKQLEERRILGNKNGSDVTNDKRQK